IQIKIMNGGEFGLNVKQSTTIDYVKEQVQDKERIPPAQQRLIFGGKQLEDGRTLSDYGISDGDTIRILVQARLTGTTFRYNVQHSSTIDSVKVQIQGTEGIPPAHQRLIFRGKLLADSRTLADYDINNGDILHLGKFFSVQAMKINEVLTCGCSPVLRKHLPGGP
ncbi:ubiquitin, partial [Mycena vitilis]